jgi:hypothetical protein
MAYSSRICSPHALDLNWPLFDLSRRCGAPACSRSFSVREMRINDGPGRGGSGGDPEMMPTTLRTAVLACVRVLLCLLGIYLMFIGWAAFSDQGPGTRVWALDALALIAAVLGLASIVTAVLLRRGRREGGDYRDRHRGATGGGRLVVLAGGLVGAAMLSGLPIPSHVLLSACSSSGAGGRRRR